MKKKELLRKIENLEERNKILITELFDYKNTQLNKKLDNILNLAREIDPSANLACTYNKTCLGFETEAILTFNVVSH